MSVNIFENISQERLLSKLFSTAELSEDLTPRQVKTIKKLKIESFFENNLILLVSSEEERELLEKILTIFITPTINNLLNNDVYIFLKIQQNQEIIEDNVAHFENLEEKIEPFSKKSIKKVETEKNFKKNEQTGLYKNLTFDNFIVSSSNNIVQSACVQVSEQPGGEKALNLLYLYGEPGLGKTHLLNAIGNNTLEIYPNKKVRYFSAEEFLVDWVDALGKQGEVLQNFEKKYGSLDVLLLDDMQFFNDKQQATTQKFLGLINQMISENKQIVITSDVAPRKLKGIHTRLISRIEGGQYWEIKKPDYELREAFIRKYIKSKQSKIQITNEQIQKIASLLNINIREIQGQIERILFYCEINKVPLSDSIIDELLQNNTHYNENEINIQQIIKIISEYYNISEEDIKSTVRSPRFVKARHIAMYLCRKFTNLTLTQIGSYFHKDHSSVVNAEKKIKKQITEKTQSYNDVEEIIRRIKT